MNAILCAETVESTEGHDGGRPHCLFQRLARAAAANPAGLFAVLAGTAFLFLLGTFIAQLVCAIVCEVRLLCSLPAIFISNP